MIKQNQKLLNILLVLLDVIVCGCSIILSYSFWFTFVYSGPHLELIVYWRLMVVVIPAYVFIYYACELHVSYRFKSLLSECGRIIQANGIGLLGFFVFLFMIKAVDISRPVVLLFGLFNSGFSMLLRASLRRVLRYFRKQGMNLKHFLVVGWNEGARSFTMRAIANKGLGCYIDGFFTDEIPEDIGEAVPHLGTISCFDAYLAAHPVQEVVISLDYHQLYMVQHLLEVCELEGVKSSLLPFYGDYMPSRPYVEDFEGLPLINMRHIPLDSVWSMLLKRGFDIFVSLSLLLVLSPVLLGVSIGVALTSPGSILYRQARVGRNKKHFTIYKFRSMRVDESGEDQVAWSSREDVRRTSFGSFIRKYSLDELPQLFNVLAGDMSLVGPRPEIPFYVEKFKEEVPLYMLKHLVRPGITGWAQVNGWRGDTSIIERIRCDIHYIENWTFLLDIKILFLTLFRGIINSSE